MMTKLVPRWKKMMVATMAGVGLLTFATAWSLDVYWSESRRQPDPGLRRVIEAADHGHKFYLTVAESRLIAEPVFVCAASLIGVAAFLNQRWSSSRR